MRPMVSPSETVLPGDVQRRARKTNVLIAVRTESTVELIRTQLRKIGFRNMFFVEETADAVRILREQQIHLIIVNSELKVTGEPETDMSGNMPLSGIHFVHRLRHAPQSPAPFTPVLLLMKQAEGNAVVLARDAGVNEIVLKPIQTHDFFSRVVQMIMKPRALVTASNYKGPCRRRQSNAAVPEERRVRDIRVVRADE